ncbi:MAG: response regulator [Bacteroidales bacterium]|nr:response regulator [Bacteroidales bacterium]
MSKLIFFVDDDKMIINLLEYTFQSRQQYDVKAFESGEDCLNSIDLNPDLIVLDHNLSTDDDSKMNGLQTLEKIKSIKSDLPVIMLTAYGTEELLRKSLEIGAVRFLTKDDYFIDTLIQMIDEVLY